MDRFLELLRQEFAKELASGFYAKKEKLLAIFDRACVRALIRYAREKGVDLT